MSVCDMKVIRMYKAIILDDIFIKVKSIGLRSIENTKKTFRCRIFLYNIKVVEPLYRDAQCSNQNW